MSKPVNRLGRGLSSLISTQLRDAPAAAEQPVTPTASVESPPQIGAPPSPHIRVMLLPIKQIRTNPSQPRRAFDEQAIAGLAASLKQKGTLQPIVVRPAVGGYELVAGERRLRAAAHAGLDEIPALVRSVHDDEMLELALTENIQRTDLNPVERAKAYNLLAAKQGLTHDQIAERMGEDRVTVTNYLRLLQLQEDALALVATGELSTGHAKALLGITDKQLQSSVAIAAVRGKWSVRQIEAAAAKSKADRAAKPAAGVRAAVRDLEQLLESALGTRVRILEGRRRHAGRLIIEYYTLDDFQRITGRLGLVAEPA